MRMRGPAGPAERHRRAARMRMRGPAGPAERHRGAADARAGVRGAVERDRGADDAVLGAYAVPIRARKSAMTGEWLKVFEGRM